jgi:hypothetical protein
VCGPVYIDFNVNRTIGPGQPPDICSPKQTSDGAWKQQIDALPETSTLGRRYDCVVSSSCDCMVNTVFISTTISLPSYRPFVPVLLQVHSYRLQ